MYICTYVHNTYVYTYVHIYVRTYINYVRIHIHTHRRTCTLFYTCHELHSLIGQYGSADRGIIPRIPHLHMRTDYCHSFVVVDMEESRFASVSEDEIERLLRDKDSENTKNENTKKSTKVAVGILKGCSVNITNH